MSVYQHITGTFDLLPDTYAAGGTTFHSTAAWRALEQHIRQLAIRFGFQEIRTPILEPTELIARGLGGATDVVSKEMFAFEREGTRYVLRPELTAPVMRSVVERRLDQKGVQKLFYIGPCFRAERPQKGRYRQFHQFGVELLGSPDPIADAEVILFMLEVYRSLGIENTKLRLNNLGDAASRAAYRDALQTYFAPHAELLSETSRKRLETNPLRILDTKLPHERALLEGAPKLSAFISDEASDHYEKVKSFLRDAGQPFVEDPYLVRGLDYYNRTAFELESPDLGAQSALAGGGRYDGLASEIGASVPIPAVGFAAGIERLFIALEAKGFAFAQPEVPDVYVLGLDPDSEAVAFGLTQHLRRAQLHVRMPLKKASFKNMMKEATSSGATWLVLIGETERQTLTAQVKHLARREQTAVPFDALLDFLTQNA